MSDEKPKGNGDGGGQGNGDAGAPAAISPIGRLAGRYSVVNIGFELKESGESLMRTGTLAGEIRGDQRASQLLVIRKQIIDLKPLIDKVAAFLREEARQELNSSIG